MGLDMYLNKKTYVGNNYKEEDEQLKITKPKKHDGVFRIGDVKQERIIYIEEQVAHWRKANQIHKWFVDVVAEGDEGKTAQDLYIDPDQLEELLERCKKVVKASKLVKAKVTNGYKYKNGEKTPIKEDGYLIEDPSLAKELLPTTEGFFFGNQEYNHWYIEDLKTTIEVITEVLKEKHGDFYYHASW